MLIVNVKLYGKYTARVLSMQVNNEIFCSTMLIYFHSK